MWYVVSGATGVRGNLEGDLLDGRLTYNDEIIPLHVTGTLAAGDDLLWFTRTLRVIEWNNGDQQEREEHWCGPLPAQPESSRHQEKANGVFTLRQVDVFVGRPSEKCTVAAMLPGTSLFVAAANGDAAAVDQLLASHNFERAQLTKAFSQAIIAGHYQLATKLERLFS